MWLVKKVRKERELCLCVCVQNGERDGRGLKVKIMIPVRLAVSLITFPSPQNIKFLRIPWPHTITIIRVDELLLNK